jgi:IclR family KDG regulon transcriptional repressor
VEKETSLDKALIVLEAIAEEGKTGVNKLAQITGFPPATVHRILSVLVRRRYVRKDPATRKYLLSLKCLELSSKLREKMGIIEVARPVMQELKDMTGETVNLVVFDSMEAVYVDQVTNTNSFLRMFTRVGSRASLYCSGVGKAFLAAQSDDVVLDYFQNVEKICHTQNTIIDQERFIEELRLIRTQGYSVDQEEFENGVGCVAAVIYKPDGIEGAISVSGPYSRLFANDVKQLGFQVIVAAKSISERLAYN